MSCEKVKLTINPTPISDYQKIKSLIIDEKLYLSKNRLEIQKLRIVDNGSQLFANIITDSKDNEKNNKVVNGEENTVEIKSIENYENIVNKGNSFVSDTSGIFIIEDKIPKIVEVLSDGFFELKISEDKMELVLNIYPAINNGKKNGLEPIMKSISELGIKTKVDKNYLSRALTCSRVRKRKVENLIISRGKSPIDGNDGWIECTIPIQSNENKLDNENTRKDFHKVEQLLSTEQNQEIAKIHPATMGIAGYDIFGKVIPAKDGKFIKANIGANTFISDADENLIFSKIDGFIDFIDGKISVKDTLIIKGNIDFHCGEIVGHGSVKVLGDILNGFNIRIKNNLEVGGYIGDSFVETGGSVSATGGFLGTGDGEIRANGDVNLKFIQNQKVYCRESLNFSREIVQSELYVRDKIKGMGQHASIIGGYTIAGNLIEVHNLGNEYGIKTSVEVGFDYGSKEKLIENRKLINEIRKKLKQIDDEIFEYSKMKRIGIVEMKKFQKLIQEHKNIEENIKNISKENKSIIKNIRKPSSAEIKISGYVYPGVKIHINRKSFTVTEAIKNKTFRLTEEELVII